MSASHVWNSEAQHFKRALQHLLAQSKIVAGMLPAGDAAHFFSLGIEHAESALASEPQLDPPWSDLHAAYTLIWNLRGQLQAADPYWQLARAALEGLCDEELRIREGRSLRPPLHPDKFPVPGKKEAP